MIDKFQSVQWIAFDLDGTLYQPTQEEQIEINNRIRNKIAEKILERNKTMNTVQEARTYFEDRFSKLHSGSKVLKEVGYENPSQIMNDCQEQADIIDLINPDPELAKILHSLKSKYKLCLLSSSPERVALSKLEKIGLEPDWFTIKVYNDTEGCGSKTDGKAFEYLLSQTKTNAEKHLYVGDTLNKDILPAKSKGMLTLAVGSNINEADYSINKIKEIERILL